MRYTNRASFATMAWTAMAPEWTGFLDQDDQKVVYGKLTAALNMQQANVILIGYLTHG